jgi:anthranilate phosphoribosyltransferase
MSSVPAEEDAKVSITPLLKRLWHESPSTKPTADEIAGALSLITDQDRQAEVLAKCSKAMRDFSTKIEVQELVKLLQERGRKEGNYHGGFVSFLSS